MGVTGSPADSIKLGIWSDNAGEPGTLIHDSDDTILGSDMDTAFLVNYYIDYNFTAGPSLVANTQYWIVLERTGALSDTNYYELDGGMFTGYSRGSLWELDGSWGAGWVDSDVGAGGLDIDLYFIENYDNTTAATSTSTSSTSTSTSSRGRTSRCWPTSRS